jgi:hypothetical protein
VLLCQDFGWHHQRTLSPTIAHSQEREECHDGLPRPDVTLKESVHWKRTRQVAADLVEDTDLCGGERKRQTLEKLASEWQRIAALIGDVDWRVNESPGRSVEDSSTEAERQLQPQELIEGQSATSMAGFHLTRRLVDVAHRCRSVDETELLAHRLGERIGEGARSPQRLGDELSEVIRGESNLATRGVDGNEPQEAIGGHLLVLSFVRDDVDDWIRQLATFPEVANSPEEQREGSWRQLVHPPRLIEEHHSH